MAAKNIWMSVCAPVCYHNPARCFPYAMNHPLDASVSGFDPFAERREAVHVACMQVLGARLRFESASAALLAVVQQAYAGLPQHRFPGEAPGLTIELRLVASHGPFADEPPPVRTQSGAGWLCGVMDSSNYVVMAPEQGRALVVVSEALLQWPYHLRYELIEFAVFTLATRRLGLVPLHGACVGSHGRGVLLLGASGAGKSTLALHSLLEGLDFLAEDAVFVEPESMLATGVANFLHIKAEALPLIDDARARAWIGDAPVIRRRSGVQKHEADLRGAGRRLAQAPLALAGAVFVSAERGERHGLLRPLPAGEVAQRMAADQPYAAGQPGWRRFLQQLSLLGVHELRRGSHPRHGVDALRGLLG